jgi:hypothetical protein
MTFISISALALCVAEAESVPLKSEGGTFVVPVLINDKITLDFTLDSGAADVSIPLDVFSTLKRTETISDDDLLPAATYALADGSVQRQVRFRIRTLKVGSLELPNVVGSVAPIRGSLLLGQSFLSRLSAWSVDNQRHVLIINEAPPQTPRSQYVYRAVPTAPSQPTSDSEDYQCGAAQNLCREGAALCQSYRDDFRRDHRYCAGVTDETSSSTTPAVSDSAYYSDYSCAAARNLCRDSAPLCAVYRKEFKRAHRYCAGVTD